MRRILKSEGNTLKKRKKQPLKKKLKRIWLISLACIMGLEIAALANLDNLKTIFLSDVSAEEPDSDASDSDVSEPDASCTQKEEDEPSIEDVTKTPVKQTATKESAVPKNINKFIFVGDSRYVAMSMYAEDEDIFIAENGMAYSYLKSQLSTIKKRATKNSAVIIGLGVNDAKYCDPQDYIDTVNKLAKDLPCTVCYMLVNPVDEEKERAHGYSVTNKQINTFNNALKKGLSDDVIIIDTNSYLKKEGYKTEDGLHYDNATYKLIYDYIKDVFQ